MNKLVGKHEKEMPMVPQRKRSKWLLWLVGSLCMFAALYGASYLALFWLPPYEGVDMRSQLQADYSGWGFLVFQPVDPSVIEEIRQERGLPEQIISDGSFSPTSNSTNITPLITSEATEAPVSITLAPENTPLSSATADQPLYTSTPIPTSIILTPEPVVTLQAVETSIPTSVVNPAITSKPRRTARPEKTSKPPKDPKN